MHNRSIHAYVLTLILIASLASTILSAYAIDRLDRQDEKAQVYITCNTSRLSSIINERECGNLQDKYRLTFRCVEYNNGLNNFCYVIEGSTN